MSGWDERPTDDVVFGLRILSADDRKGILKDARERVAEGGESSDFQESFELAVLRLFAARVICDPNDSSKASSIFKHPDDNVFIHLTEGGARRVYDAARRVEVECSPLAPEATPDDLIRLIAAIGDGALSQLSSDDRPTVMRHLKYALDIIDDSVKMASSELTEIDEDLIRSLQTGD